MNFRTPLFFFIISLLYLSCSKESNSNPNNNPPKIDKDPVDSVIGNKNTTASTSIFPVSAGSVWKYVSKTDDLAADTITITLSNLDTTINSKIYHKALAKHVYHPDSLAYYSADNHIYAFQNPDLVFNYTFNLQVLNDTASVGYSWIGPATNSNLLNHIPVRAITTIKEKNIVKTVSGEAYQNVTHTQVEVQYLLEGQIIKYATFDFFLAPRIGIIEYDYDQTGNHYTYNTLTAYNIK